jgi:SAM-dependent methyltransferase
MKRKQYQIRFPAIEPHQLGQDQAFFFLEEDGEQKPIRFHDYAEIYNRRGLYEQLFYDRLKCSSPKMVCAFLKSAVDDAKASFTELRVLDVGAGNGMMGEELYEHGVARLVGVDIIKEAEAAAVRDRPGIYDAYYTEDLTTLSDTVANELSQWRFDAMTCVAALGFGDIPPAAFFNAYNLVATGGWIAFNIKDTFLGNQDRSGFSMLIKQMIFGDYLEVHHLERYRHRISIDGRPLYYYAVIGRKELDIPKEVLQYCDEYQAVLE